MPETRSSALGASIPAYSAAILLPLAMIVAIARTPIPAFVFEHVIVLLVVGAAVRWGLGPAVMAAGTAVAGDNLLLREPIGTPAITGVRDAVDLALFLAVAVTVAWLVARAQHERRRAEEAAARERQIRQDRDRLVATISHDLATPLTAIRGTIQFAKQFGNAADVDLPRLIERIDTAAARATSLMKTLSDVRAIDQGGFAVELREFDLRDMLAPVARMFDRASDRHPIAVAVPDRPVPVRCDPDRLQRVMENLASNAIKYSPDGGLVEITLDVVENAARLSVRDHGIGIPESDRTRIFERGYRAPGAMQSAPGLGLGLSISSEIVRQHGGSIEAAAPAEGKGSIVTVRIPLAPSATRKDAPMAAAAVE